MEDTMDILHIERKGPLMNTPECFHIYSLSKGNLQMNDTYADMHNLIFNVIKEHCTIKNPIPHPTYQSHSIPYPHPPSPILPTTFINTIHTTTANRGHINMGTWPSRLKESQMRQQNMVVSSAGLQPKSDCSGKAQKKVYSKIQTRPLVREGALQNNKPATV
jgi:hypothetical protein